MISFTQSFPLLLPQWGAADTEIKVPSVENTALKVFPLKHGVG